MAAPGENGPSPLRCASMRNAKIQKARIKSVRGLSCLHIGKRRHVVVRRSASRAELGREPRCDAGLPAVPSPEAAGIVVACSARSCPASHDIGCPAFHDTRLRLRPLTRTMCTAIRIHPTTPRTTSSETVPRTAAHPGGPKPPSHRDARSQRRRTRKQEGRAGALSFSLRRDDLPITCLTCGPGRGARSPPPRGRRCPIETTGTSTQLPTMRGVES
jgi:hypothetical protein